VEVVEGAAIASVALLFANVAKVKIAAEETCMFLA
jgi:hypothetical protein